jgi:hypothetical protein
MNRFLRGALWLPVVLAAIEFVGPDKAFARGGAANIMNSPGYQRRLQESRGYVTNQSGSISAPQNPSRVYHRTKVRRHR